MAIKYRDKETGEYKQSKVLAKVPKKLSDQVEKNTESVGELKAEITNVRALLAQVRDALQNGDIDEAINLLDTFLLDEGVLE